MSTTFHIPIKCSKTDMNHTVTATSYVQFLVAIVENSLTLLDQA